MTAAGEGVRLWDSTHPYYATEGNFYKVGRHGRHDSWADFVEDGGPLYDGDDDLNYLWRWDWKRVDPDDYAFEREEDPDFVLPGDTLQLFYMLQRKAICLSVEVGVVESDEADVRAWLSRKAGVVAATWAPLLAEVSR